MVPVMGRTIDTGLCMNEDNSHWFASRAGKPVSGRTADEWVDQYAGTQVRELILCPNCMRTSFDSAVWDPIWRGYDPDGPDDQPLLASTAPAGRAGARRWIHTAWAYREAGIDVYRRWIDRARALGLSPWISMRMNDVHCVDDEACYIHGELWRSRPDLRRVGYRFAGWTDRAFDFGRSEVRAHHMALIRELAERYDFDGLELDWMRFGFHFRPGFETEGATLLTEFTAEVRRHLDGWQERRGHRIALSARVPSRPQTALELGMDGAGWARAGLLDMLVVTPFWASAETDMPLETWKRLLDGTGTLLAAGLEVLIRSDPKMKPLFNSLETVRGAAASFLDRGADRVYLFNYMDSETAMEGLEDYPALLREAGSLPTLEGKPRRHVVAFADTWAPGEPRARLLPARLAPGEWGEFRLHVGPAPMRGGVRAVLCPERAWGGEPPEVRLDGTLCRPLGPVDLPMPRPDLPAFGWEAPAGALKRGHNLVEVKAASETVLRWVEIGVAGD